MVRLLGWSSGLRISTGRRVVVLRRYIGGHGSQRATGGEKLHVGRAHLRRMSGEFPSRRGPGSMATGSGRFLVLRLSSGGGL